MHLSVRFCNHGPELWCAPISDTNTIVSSWSIEARLQLGLQGCNAMKVMIAGPPGCGKGTQCAKIVDKVLLPLPKEADVNAG